MPSKPTILAFDTSAAHCAAALLSGGRIAAVRYEEMAKGQAERLVPLLQQTMEDAGADWAELDAIAVGVGPGNFTGVRISVATARGLALSLGIPAIGISAFDLLHNGTGRPDGIVQIPALRGSSYWQAYAKGQAVGAPSHGSDPQMLPSDGQAIIGPDADDLAVRWSNGAPQLFKTVTATLSWPTALEDLAHLAATRLALSNDHPAPAPVYVRPAEAAPPRDAPPVIVS
ncbi:tRNA (adenosine(37)-N6)-threonylcarbamoyltransferase complex dimerization subunit type 1 TsaB [Pseudooceanicola sp. MF1-13]|uniref:tRNA (adenosine(37)-N6)-threonylcarbamoyltransferase complex dimerization subunit type 1 TsaB n=1 Tax=Pseudooceanicola sp. MF1-13 TaxID=3379095 RepID=UPI00389292DB